MAAYIEREVQILSGQAILTGNLSGPQPALTIDSLRCISEPRGKKPRVPIPARIGYFGASTGSAAALVAAAKFRDRVSAVVSRGGRPDLADEALPHVTAPTLLIVGGADDVLLALPVQGMRRAIRTGPEETGSTRRAQSKSSTGGESGLFVVQHPVGTLAQRVEEKARSAARDRVE